MLDAFSPAIVALVFVLAVVGAVVVIAQARYEYRKRKAHRDIDQIVRGRR